MKPLFLPFLLFSLLTIYAVPAAADEDCLACHSMKGMRGYVDAQELDRSVHKGIGCRKCHIDVSGAPHGKVRQVNCGVCHFLGRQGAPKEQALEYKMSVHGTATRRGVTHAPVCQTCHGSHAILRSSDARSATYRTKVPALCGRCHPAESAQYEKSIHGESLLKKGNTAAASCFNCHMEHTTPAAGDPSWKLNLIRECGACHAEEMNTYRKTFHGKVTGLGYDSMAKCADCHGSHNILALSDERSLLSSKNRLATCRGCHPNATEPFTKYYAHAEEMNRAKYPELFWTYAFMTVLLIGVFAFFFTHTFLWAFRSMKERMLRKGGN